MVTNNRNEESSQMESSRIRKGQKKEPDTMYPTPYYS